MHHADSRPLVPSVKLFPRLAMKKPSQKPRRSTRIDRAHLHRPESAPGDDPRSQVRERLLRMILDNEQVRRNEQRPSAS